MAVLGGEAVSYERGTPVLNFLLNLSNLLNLDECDNSQTLTLHPEP